MDFKNKLMASEKILWNADFKNIPIIFWGCGNSMHVMKDVLKEKGISPSAYCDNNSQLIGKMIDNIPILSYKQIRERYEHYLIILTVAINNAIPIVEQLKKEHEKNPIFHVEHPFKVEKGFLEYESIEERIEDFETVYGLLQDELSKDIFVNCINFKLTGNKLPLLRYVDGDTFFDKEIIPKSYDYTYVDVGAYTGDTLLRFYAFCEGRYNRIYGIEPDTGNYNALCELVKYGRLERTSLFHVGGWNQKGELRFYTVANENNLNFDSPNFFKWLEDSNVNSWGISRENYGMECIPVDTVDNLLQENKCDIIKINALGADYHVLKGCKKTIELYKPVLVGEFGAQKEHLTDLLYEMHKYNPNYKLYLRQKMIFGDCKTVYYAVEL